MSKEPLDWLSLFRQQMDEIFRFLSALEGKEGFSEQQENLPLADIYETDDAFVVEVELPGCRLDEVSLNVCCSALMVEGVKREEARPGVNYSCLERRFGRFFRAIEIPPSVDLDAARATLAKGLLTVHFPWRADRRTHIRTIPIEEGEERSDGKQAGN